MVLKIVLGVIYYFGGIIISCFGAMCLGFIVAAFIALVNVTSYKWTWLQIVVHLGGAMACIGLIQLAFFGAGTLGDNTDYKMQKTLLVGAIFPGGFMLAVIPAYAKIALNYSRGEFDKKA